MEPEKTPNSQRNVEKENQNWWHHNSGLQALLQSCSNQNSMVLAQKQTQRSIEQYRKPINKPVIIYGGLIFNEGGKYALGKREFLQQMVLGKLDKYCKGMKMDIFLNHT